MEINNKIKIAISVLIVAILFVSAIEETVVYYNNKISNLNSQISKLNDIITNLPTAHLVASLGIIEMQGNESTAMGKPTPVPYNYLQITGFVNNTGENTAFNAGLHVVAYCKNGILEINVTVPLSGGIFGADNATNAFVLSKYGSYNYALGVYVGYSVTLGVLYGDQKADFGSNFFGGLSIFHEGTVTNWTVTPVWTNTP